MTPSDLYDQAMIDFKQAEQSRDPQKIAEADRALELARARMMRELVHQSLKTQANP